MSDTLTRSRGAELLAGEFSEFAADLADDVAKENPKFSADHIALLVTAWADWATLVADDPFAGYALTVDMHEVWHAALRPRLALISCGEGNPYGHPSPRTVDHLRALGATVLRTDRVGDIAVTGDSPSALAVAVHAQPAHGTGGGHSSSGRPTRGPRAPPG